MQKNKEALLVEERLGVWRVLMEKESSINFVAQWKTAAKLASDVYSVGPNLLSLILLAKAWTIFESILLLHLSSRILSIIEIGLKEGQPDTNAIVESVVLRVLVLAISSFLSWYRRTHMVPTMRNRVTHHFQNVILTANLKMDLPTLNDNLPDNILSADPVWDTFMELFELVTASTEVVGLLIYICQLAVSSRHGPAFVLLCLGKPVLTFLYRTSLWEIGHIAQVTDPNYLRMQALNEMGNTQFRQDIISGGLVQYIMDEYDEARVKLGDTPIGYPADRYDELKPVESSVSLELLGDFPMLYYVANAILNPAKFSLSSIAILQHAESILKRRATSGLGRLAEVRRGLSFMNRIYVLSSISNAIKDGELRYTPTTQAEMAGMALDFRNVSFSYPGSKLNAKALDNVSFSIGAGQLVVLVGANGSGKSTIVKLMARLYDSTAGSVLVDGEDIQSYRMADLRAATASLTQDHHVYPLSLAENIGVGNPNRLSDNLLVQESAKKGGAGGFVSKLGQGYSTVLDPMSVHYGVNVQVSDKTPLAEELKKLKKTTDISGGERQRLVASRTFMRFTSEAVRLMIADEGSSALDPEGEWELFKNLRDERSGKTMVFVTHRFGHLTKHADLILCMKAGRVVESGTHEQLIKIPDGEYLKLYDIQAQAFESK